MGSDAHIHRLQPRCRSVLHDLLFPFSRAIVETPQVCHFVSAISESASDYYPLYARLAFFPAPLMEEHKVAQPLSCRGWRVVPTAVTYDITVSVHPQEYLGSEPWTDSSRL